MYAIVCGGRDYRPSKEDEAKLVAVLRWMWPHAVLHGDCKGVDRWAETVSIAEGIPVIKFPADWNTHKRKAGPLRNSQMAFWVKSHGGGVCLAFPGGAGTRNMIEQARDCGLVVFDSER